MLVNFTHWNKQWYRHEQSTDGFLITIMNGDKSPTTAQCFYFLSFPSEQLAEHFSKQPSQAGSYETCYVLSAHNKR